MLSLQPPLPWETWQELREESTKNPESVFSLMLEARVSLWNDLKNNHWIIQLTLV